MEIEHHLLFAVLALQLELINPSQLADACAGWAARRDKPLADLIRERGWLSDGEQKDVERLLERKLKKHDGDARAGLRESLDERARSALRAGGDEVQNSLDGLSATEPEARPASQGSTEADSISIVPTVDFVPQPRRFTNIRLHGEGGLGQVWRTRDEEIHRDIALKRIKPERRDHPEARSQFHREALITGQLEHPNIVPVYDLGHNPADHDPYYVMKLVRGKTLREAVRAAHKRDGESRGAPVRRRLLNALVQVGHALAYAHSRGVLHLDLKPSNVVLGDFGEVIVLDWGLARLADRETRFDDADRAQSEAPTIEAIVLSGEALAPGTTAGRVQGTKEYMAPEQAAGAAERFDERTDVFGLGGILFEILTGRAPRRFDERDSIMTILDRILTEPVPPCEGLGRTIPAALATLCSRALEHDPARRIASAAAFVAELENWLADEPLMAYREIIAGFEKMVRNHPGVIDYREQLARSRASLGLVLDGLGRAADAVAAYRSAISEYECVVGEQPLLPGPRADMAATRTHLHRALVSLGRADEAEAARLAALADYNALAEAHPAAAGYATGLESVYLTLIRKHDAGEPPSPPAADDAEQSTLPQSQSSVSHEVDRPPSTFEPRATGVETPGKPAEPRIELPPLGDRGRLEILNVHASGGLGTIYRARDHDLNRDVIVKVIGPGREDAEAQRRFRREAQIAAQLEHPHIMPIYGLGYRSQDNAPFLIMRLVDGSTLQREIREYNLKRGPGGAHTAGLRELITWLAEVCDALAYAHSRGIVHRDPKPGNVLIGPSREAILTDWGLAGRIDRSDEPESNRVDLSDQTTLATSDPFGSVIGTPAYMAPEQVLGDVARIDHRTDIYNLGAGLFQMLTGEPPYRQKGSVAATLHAILKERAPSAHEVDRATPRALDAICSRAMARDPSLRYATALELKHDLSSWLSGGAISAYPESRLTRAWRRARGG